jgi:hypothetical protein
MGFAESDRAAQSELVAFRDTLAKVGWIEGSNLRMEVRWAAGDADRMKTFAKELIDLRPDDTDKSAGLSPLRVRPRKGGLMVSVGKIGAVA